MPDGEKTEEVLVEADDEHRLDGLQASWHPRGEPPVTVRTEVVRTDPRRASVRVTLAAERDAPFGPVRGRLHVRILPGGPKWLLEVYGFVRAPRATDGR